MNKPYKSPMREHKRLDPHPKTVNKKEVIMDNSISVVSSVGGSGKEVLIKTGNKVMKSKPKGSRKSTMGGAILKARGYPLKSGQIIKRDGISKVINHIPKGKNKTSKGNKSNMFRGKEVKR